MPNWTKDQKLAIDEEGKNIIVSAGAGSGKTAVLTARVIRKLKSGVDINKLLVLTFTNEAAGEMKERIRKEIKKERDLKQQLDYIDSSYITTFDSYAFSLVRKYNYAMNVSKNIKIIDQSIINIIRKQFLEDIFDEMYQKKEKKFVKLIKDFCIKDDKEIKKAILKLNSKLDLKLDKEKYLDNYIENYYNEEYITKIVKEYLSILFDKINDINNTLDIIKLKEDNNIYEEYYKVLNNLIVSKNYKEIKSSLEITLPRLKKDSCIKEEKEKISEIIKEITKLTVYKDEQEIISTYKSTKEYVEVIINIIKMLDNKVAFYKIEKNSYEFTDISKMAINIVKNNSDIKDEVKEYYNEIMVDEYQDTSDLQESFINEIANNNVYMVGDIKQSIYRFRNANPNIFKNKYDRYSQGLGGMKIDLLKNFRSRNEVLEDINIIFSSIMDNYIGGADYIKEHQMVFGNEKYVNEGKTDQNNNLEILNYDNSEKKYTNLEIEVFAIAQNIKEKIKNKYQVLDKKTSKLRDITYNDFCIILDRGTDFSTYQKIFEYLSIPLTIFQDEDLTSSTDIILINNILKFIIKIKNKEFDQEYRYLFTSISRSYLFSKNDQEIFDIFKNNSFYKTEVHKLAEEIANKLDTLTSYKIINMIINNFDIILKTITIGDISKTLIRLEYLKQISKGLDDLGYTPYMLKEYFEEMISGENEIKYKLNTKDESSVKIMNIHKSKGLEFSICYYAGLYKTFNTSDIKDRFLYNEKYGIITPFFSEGIGEIITKELTKTIYNLEEISEKIRLFYVAVTRAKEKMIILAPLNDSLDEEKNLVSNNTRLKYRSLLDIINSIKEKLQNKIVNIDIDSIGITNDYDQVKKFNYKKYIDKSSVVIKNISLENNYINKKDEHFSKTINKIISKEEKNILEEGKKVHYAFEICDFKKIDSIENNYKENISNFLKHKEVEDILNAKIYKEYEFMCDDGSSSYTGIIDLLLEYDDKIKIIDYKLSNIDSDAYIKQLNGYKKYIESISDKKVFAYLYSILKDEFKNV